jgi:hypothetical protein
MTWCLVNELNQPVPAYLEASNIYDYFGESNRSSNTYESTIHRRTLCIINRIRIQTRILTSKLKFKYFPKSILNRLVANNINKSVMGSGITFFF